MAVLFQKAAALAQPAIHRCSGIMLALVLNYGF
jgi:hypothetical protein